MSDVGSYELDQGEISGVISDFIKSLDPESEILFVRRYIYLESVASLAKRFEMDENHVSVKLYRARKKLKKALEKLYGEQIFPAIKKGLAAAVYTQLADVEDEVNGLITHDRAEVKLPTDEIRKIVEYKNS